MRELAASRVRFGYRRLTVMLRRESWAVNAKRIYRLYTEDGLAVRTKVRKKIARRSRVPALRATRPNDKWSMDFVAARLIDGRWFRVLTVVDQFTRECLVLLADSSLTGQKVALALSNRFARSNQSVRGVHNPSNQSEGGKLCRPSLQPTGLSWHG
jgi:putative transposase